MNQHPILKLIEHNILLLDGAMGTALQAQGLPLGVCPEQWILDNPKVCQNLQQSYLAAGSQILYTPTFGANSIKLQEYGLQDQVIELNCRLAELTKAIVTEGQWVAGNLSSTGQSIKPVGTISFECMIEVYKQQVQGLLAGGVDLFVIETMIDIQEARAALIAVKESCDLPVFVSMTFEKDNRTLTGTPALTALVTLQSLGADAVGCNCSSGPAQMIAIMEEMKPSAKIPLLVKPNAGLPQLRDGAMFFPMNPKEFGTFIPALVKAGANIIGGCCGTTAEHIAEIHKQIVTLQPIPPQVRSMSALTSAQSFLAISEDQPTLVLGERINPTGKKKLQSQLLSGKLDVVQKFAYEQITQGAAMLDVNVGMPGLNEKETMVQVVEFLSTLNVPLVIDSTDPEVIAAALRVYPGRALVNSISLEEAKTTRLLEICAKYGAMFILLPLNAQEIPKTAEQKQQVIEELIHRARNYGFTTQDIVIDGLVMTISSSQDQALETLKTINWCKKELGCHTLIGLSNISFGLPERPWINSSFLAMAIHNGLSMVIANPSDEIVMHSKAAADLISGRDKTSQNYITHFRKTQTTEETQVSEVFQGIINGERTGILARIRKSLDQGRLADELVNQELIPAITRVGELFEQQTFFLPQLILSAQTMSTAMEYLKPLLNQDDTGQQDQTTVILATVKGDIHDIGKNLVALLLQNHGFRVVDLGKDVAAETIISSVIHEKATIIGLSALMTTTMPEMKRVVELVKANNLPCKVMVGGAAVSQEYAQEIGAYYGADANDAVKLAKTLRDTYSPTKEH